MGAPSTARATRTSECPNCGAVFTDPELSECPLDGAKLMSERGSQTLVDRVVGGRYRILSRLGEGGMGTVYVAEHALSLRRVALKIIRPELESSDIARKRFLRECRALERVQSPHVVQVLESGQSPAGEVYIVMELLEGETLGERIDTHGALALPEALDVASQVCSGLRAAHTKGVVHRDLKPENVFLCADGTVRVLDFGIARLQGDTRGDEMSVRKLTRTGTVVGTAAYISPEGATGADVGPAGDLYSFGVMLFETLTGRLPFYDTEPVLLMGMHIKDEAPSLREVCSERVFPPTLVSLVERLLAKRPRDRPADAEAVLGALAAARAELDAAAPIPVREIRQREVATAIRAAASGRRWNSPLTWLLLMGGLVVIAGLAGGAVALWVSNHERMTSRPAPRQPDPAPDPPPDVAPADPAVAPPPVVEDPASVVNAPAGVTPRVAPPASDPVVEPEERRELDSESVVEPEERTEVEPERVETHAPQGRTRPRGESSERRDRDLVRDYF